MVAEKKVKALYKAEIPIDWSVKRIGKMTKILAGGTPSTGENAYWGGQIKWMSSGELNLKRVYDVEGRITELGLKSSSTRLIPPRCILIGLAGQGKTRGTVAMNMIELCTNQSVAAILPSDQFDEEFLYQNLDSRYDELRQLSTGDGGRGGLNLNIINSIQIHLPPFLEQRAIASCLSTWDTAIQKTELLIAQKELHKKWLMQNLLTGKMRLKGFNNDWKFTTVSNLFKPIDRYINWNEDELFNLISIRRRNGGVFFREPLYGNQIGVKKLKTVLKDDFVISKRQVSHGAWAIIEPEFNAAKISDEYDCLEIGDKQQLIAEFWKWYCQIPILTHYANVDSDGVHIEKSIFDYNLFKKRKIRLPDSIEEQIAISAILKVADDEIRLLKAKGDKLREQKKGCMQVLLTGKVRLKIKLD